MTKHSYVQRPGMAVLLVLMMLAMTLAVGYAVSRVHTTSVFIDRNQRQRGDARTAALTGMYIALRNMHSSSWGGVGSSLSGDLGNGTSYRITFTAGDSRLTSSHPDYARLPYRVTVQSVGTATDPVNPTLSTSHEVRAVVELVPRGTAAWPTDWATAQRHQVYQWGDVPVNVELPVQWSGAVWTQGTVAFAPSYPKDDGYPFYGNIDEVAVFDKALSPLSIGQIYLASVSPGGNVANTIQYFGPRAYWRLNEAAGATTAVDSQNFQHGTYFGAKAGRASLPTGTAGSSVYFDGVNDAIDCGNFDLTSSGLTLLCWFKVDQFLTNSDMFLVGKGLEDEVRTQLWSLMLDTRGKSTNYTVKFIVTTTSGQKVVQSPAISAGVWYFAAGVYDGSRVKLYVNGVDVGNVGHSGSLLANSAARVLIGDAPPGSSRARLLRDQRAMAQAQMGDWRAAVGTWRAPASKLSREAQALLQDDLVVTVEQIATANNAPVSVPSPISSYRLYPGGPTYSVPQIGSVLENTTIVANPQSNPLGIFQTAGSLEIKGNVTVQGTLLIGPSGSVNLTGSSVRLEPIPLLTIDGESVPRRLPAVVTPADFWIHAGSQNGLIRGAVVVSNEFRFREASDMGNSCEIYGRVIAKQVTCNKRENWPVVATTWQRYLREFLTQTNERYFPLWLRANKNLRPEPQLRIAPDPSGYVDHWPNWTEPVFVVPSNEPGLRWRIVGWLDGA